jgi:hypothetical protein
MVRFTVGRQQRLQNRQVTVATAQAGKEQKKGKIKK